MPQLPDFPSPSDDEDEDDVESDDGQDRNRDRGSIIGRIIDDNGFPSPNPG